MDLGLDDPDRAAEFLGGFDRLLDRVGRNAARHGHAELGKNFLALVLVNLHEVSLGTEVENGRWKKDVVDRGPRRLADGGGE